MNARVLVGYVLGTGTRPLAVYLGDVLTIGRDPLSSVTIQDVLASRRHAVIECDAATSKVFVKDLGSANGTWLNEQKLVPNFRMILNGNDCFRIGGKLFSFITNPNGPENKDFGARLASLDTVSEGLMFKEGKVMQMKEGKLVEPDSPATAKPSVNASKDVNRTQQVVPLSALEIPASAPDLSGNLKDQNLAQIIQFLNSTQKTGELIVTGAKETGTFAFDQGQIFNAECGDRRGAPAIYVCAREHGGTFKFTSTKTPPAKQKNIFDNMMLIIFECCKRIDESQLSG
jgi:pSer/pThr/pTyr-binding forkhead associated (FHA) protein